MFPFFVNNGKVLNDIVVIIWSVIYFCLCFIFQLIEWCVLHFQKKKMEKTKKKKKDSKKIEQLLSNGLGHEYNYHFITFSIFVVVPLHPSLRFFTLAVQWPMTECVVKASGKIHVIRMSELPPPTIYHPWPLAIKFLWKTPKQLWVL